MGAGDEDDSPVGLGIPIKNLLLSTELAIESSSNHCLEYKTFMQAYQSVSRD